MTHSGMSQKDRQWFPLNEVPLRLFDAQHWAAFVDLCGSLEKAIESLDHPDPNILVYLRQEVIKQGGPDALEADKDERRRHAQESLIDAFREQLASGRVIANGIASQIGTRVSIDSALCRNLEFNFSANSVRIIPTTIPITRPIRHPGGKALRPLVSNSAKPAHLTLIGEESPASPIPNLSRRIG